MSDVAIDARADARSRVPGRPATRPLDDRSYTGTWPPARSPGTTRGSEEQSEHPLSQARQRTGLTLAEATRLLGVERSCFSRWEQGVGWPPTTLWPQFAAVLQLDTHDLFALLVENGSPGRADVGPCPGLRAMRATMHVSGGDLAAALGCGRTTVHGWESGARPLPATALLGLARLIGEDPWQVLQRLREPAPAWPAASLLRQERRRQGLTQAQLGGRAGVSAARVAKLERDEADATLHDVRAFARGLRLSPAQAAAILRVQPPVMLDARRWRPGQLAPVLRALREWSGRNRRQVAALIGHSPVSVSDWEKGRRVPRAKALVALAELYRLDPKALYQLASAAPVQTFPTRRAGTRPAVATSPRFTDGRVRFGLRSPDSAAQEDEMNADIDSHSSSRNIRVDADLHRRATSAAGAAGYRSVDVYIEDALRYLMKLGRAPWDDNPKLST